MNTENNLPVSYGYERISLTKAKRLSRAWLNKSLPLSQWQLVEPILRKKKVPSLAMPVIKIIKKLNLKRTKLLDVGCSSGYYYDFFKWAKLNVKYAGCDVSPNFIALAKKNHRWIDFRTAPLINIPHDDDAFDVVLASGVIHYELGFKKGLRELVRVSKRYVLLHRLPIFEINTKTSYYKKVGYGVYMLETIFALKFLTRIFLELGLTIHYYWSGERVDIKSSARWTTILLEKTI